MSAAEPRSDTSRIDEHKSQPHETSGLHVRRRDARRRRHLARVDLGLGLVGAILLVLAAPGLAITGLVALIVLVVCLITYAFERRRRSRRSSSR